MNRVIKKGNHSANHPDDFIHRWLIRRRVINGLALDIQFRINTQPYRLPNNDEDQNDIHKVGGLVRKVFAKSNSNNAMIGFRPKPDLNVWEFLPYFNVDYKNIFDVNDTIFALTGELITGRVIFHGKKAELMTVIIYNESGDKVQKTQLFENSKARRTAVISTWHGGKDNDGNGYGGVAPVDLHYEIAHSFKYYNPLSNILNK